MLEDLRQQANDFLGPDEPPPPPPSAHPPARILGMTPFQTFIVALLVLALTCLLSAACLLVTGRVVPPFLY